MCGRYALDQNARELANHFHLVTLPGIVPRYNIAPGTSVLVVRETAAGRVGEMMRWGLEPAWMRKGDTPRPGAPKPINARAETLAERPMFRSAFRTRRCLLPASGFYEWHRPSAGPSQPYYIRPANDPVFAFAGLYEPGDDQHPPTCCIVTTTANALMARIHDRMPVILEPSAFGAWLDPRTAAPVLAALLGPSPADEMLARAVSTRVNNARHDDPTLIDALAASPDA